MVPSASSKYYVYGGGRWRELDTATGRVSGWRGARLCVARRGRLVTQHGAARRRLLAALRALAGQQGAPAAGRSARDGPRLSTKPPTHKSTRSAACRCRCCCHHNNNNEGDNRCEGKTPVQQSLTSDACVQAAPPEPAPAPAPSPRIAFPPPSAVSAGRHLTTLAIVHNAPRETRNTSTPKIPSKRRNSSTSWKFDNESSSSSTKPPVNNANASPRKYNTSPKKTNASPRKNLSLKRKRPNSDTSDTSKDEISISQSILKKDFNAKFLRSRKTEDRPPRIRTRVIPRDVQEISSDNEYKDPSVHSRTLVIDVLDTETEEEITKHKSMDLLAQKCQKIQDKIDLYRELVISEDDVDILRRYMIRNNPQFDLYKYDNDDSYKARLFYSINPLVSMEPCPKILTMLEGPAELSLQQFASQLGLRSVSDGASSSGRAPSRKRRRRPLSSEDTEPPDSEDKENLETTLRRSNRPKVAKLKDKHNTDDRSKLKDVTVSVERLDVSAGSRARRGRRSPGSEPPGDGRRGRLNRNSNADIHLEDERRKLHKHGARSAEPMRRVNEERSMNKQKAITDKIVNGGHRAVVGAGGDDFRSKEYSSLEDHAIVSWISTGDRAKLVNGNRVWRILEQSYEGIGGRARSWHSLRNRYLRHLLPRLGHLALPAAQQARLRAAAAQGEIKGKKHPQRRNSIYGEPARGAASRAPAPASPPRRSPRTPRRAPAPARSPRYSDVTRQFAARRPPAAASSSSSEFDSPLRPRPRPPSSPARPTRSSGSGPGPRSRTRKLFNPNKL